MKKFLFLSTICSLMIACASKPSDYQTEITDAVKYYTATWQTAIEAAADDNEDSVWTVRDRLSEEYLSVQEEEAFKTMLEKDNNLWAKKILVNYSLNQPILSEYTKTDKDKEWIFQERNTGVHFYFRLQNVNNQEHFEIEPDEVETQHYLGRKLLGDKTVQLYEALGMNVDSLIDASIAETKKEEQQLASMAEIVDLLYSGKVADEKVVAFSKDLHKVIGDGNDAWAQIGYWKYSDGHRHKYTIEECVLESDMGPYAFITLTDTPQPVQIVLAMRPQGDTWIITDVMGVEEGSISYSFTDFITVELAEASSDANDEH